MTSAWNNMSFSHFQLPDTATICYLGIAAFFTYVFSTAIYNRYFHPLAKFPGPFLGSLTSWYLVHVICSVPTYGLELHKKYGKLNGPYISHIEYYANSST